MKARTPAFRVVPFAVAVLALTVRPALAAPPDDRQVRAEARFQQASAAFDQGHVDEACAAFAESLALYETVGTLLNLALCHEAQGKTASAWREFTHAAAATTDSAQRVRRDFARQHAQKLEPSLAHLIIDVAPEAGPVAVEIDGAALSAAQRALPLFVDPGDHTVTATAPMHNAFASSLHVPSGPLAAPLVIRVPALEVTPPPESSSVTPAVQPSPPKHAGRRVAGWVFGGAGVAAIAVGAVFGVEALAKMGSCAGPCNLGPAQTSESISLVAFGAGLASLGASAWLMWGPGSAPAAAVGRVQIVPAVSTRGGALDFVGRW